MPRRVVAARPDARALAHAVLVRVETTDAFADVLLAERLAAAPLAPRDRALATTLVYGTLAWQGRLDHHLTALLRSPLPTLDPPVRAALRLGLHQLLFLDRVPAFAAVDASARLARPAGRGAVGLVNAVLRRAATLGRAGLPLPDPARDPVERLAVEWSHPRWLVERWARALGMAALPALLAANNERGPTAIRATTGRDALARELAAAGIDVIPSVWAPDGLVVTRGAHRLRAHAAWRAGRFAFQGEASQLVAPLLEATQTTRIVDLCAAPGGKATHAAATGGLVVALDRRTTGVRRIVTEATRLRAARLHALVGDGRCPAVRGPVDAVLVDAPCSGLGTLRRHPEVRWRRRPEDIPRLADLQHALLTGAAPLVRPGGVLLYAVCTLTHEENEGVIARFVADRPRFSVEPIGTGPSAALATPEGWLRTRPDVHGLDGFFIARLRAAP